MHNYSPAFKRKMYLIQNVKGRSGIRIHSGNVAGDKDLGLKTDFQGCIAFGSSTGIMHGQKAVLNTAYSIREIEKYLNYEPFTLAILGDFE